MPAPAANNDDSFERLTSLLLDYGHRDIVAVNGLAMFRYAAARAASFHHAYAARGLVPAGDAVEFVSMTEATGYETAMRRLGGTIRPTAFICGSVFQARGIYRAVAACRLEVGRDISVVAHDDGVRGCNPAEFSPPLTTFTPVRSAGEVLARILIDLIEGKVPGPVRSILPFDLILLGSVALAGRSP